MQTNMPRERRKKLQNLTTTVWRTIRDAFRLLTKTAKRVSFRGWVRDLLSYEWAWPAFRKWVVSLSLAGSGEKGQRHRDHEQNSL